VQTPTRLKTNPTITALCAGNSIMMNCDVTAIDIAQPFGLGHWIAAACKKVNGCRPVSYDPIRCAVAVRHAT
jgi:hypothetical protein